MTRQTVANIFYIRWCHDEADDRMGRWTCSNSETGPFTPLSEWVMSPRFGAHIRFSTTTTHDVFVMVTKQVPSNFAGPFGFTIRGGGQQSGNYVDIETGDGTGLRFQAFRIASSAPALSVSRSAGVPSGCTLSFDRENWTYEYADGPDTAQHHLDAGKVVSLHARSASDPTASVTVQASHDSRFGDLVPRVCYSRDLHWAENGPGAQLILAESTPGEAFEVKASSCNVNLCWPLLQRCDSEIPSYHASATEDEEPSVETYISKLEVTVGAGAPEASRGWHRLPFNVNAGTAADPVFVWYQTSKATSEAITRVQVSFKPEQDTVLDKAGYCKAKVDLNKGTGKPAIYLWTFKGDPVADIPITDVTITDESNEAKVDGALTDLATTSDWQRSSCDLNRGTGGTSNYLWVKRAVPVPICDVTVTTTDNDSKDADVNEQVDLLRKGYLRMEEDVTRGTGGKDVYIWYRYGDGNQSLVSNIAVSTTSRQRGLLDQRVFDGRYPRYEYPFHTCGGTNGIELNKGTDGAGVYLWKNFEPRLAPIHQLVLVTSKDQRKSFTASGYTMLNQDLTTGAGSSKDIFIGFRRLEAGTSITDLRVSDSEDFLANSTTRWACMWGGLTEIPVDLNKGAGGKNLFLWYTRMIDFSPPITNISVTWNEEGQRACKAAGFEKSSVDLNEGAGGSDLYLYYKRAAGAAPISAIRVTTDHDYESLIKAGYTRVSVDLNRSAGGKDIFLWMKPPGYSVVDEIDVSIGYDDDKRLYDENFIKIGADLNRNAGGKDIFLWFHQSDGSQKASPDHPGPISRLAVSTSKEEESELEARGFTAVKDSQGSKKDLNKGAGGKDIYLWYKRDPEVNPISGVAISYDSDTATAYNKAGLKKIPKDLNEGAGGDDIYLWYSGGPPEEAPHEPVSDYGNWMQEVGTKNPLFPSKRLCDIVIPGTHDSGTYSLGWFSDTTDCDNPLPWWLSWLPSWWANPTLGLVMYSWAKTLGVDIARQLQDGIRYLDLRVCKDRIVHGGLLGDHLDAVIDQVAAFVGDHPKEVLILDFNHFWNMTDGDHDNLIQSLRSKLSGHLAPVSLGPTATIQSFWDKRCQVIVYYRDEQARKRHNRPGGNEWLWNNDAQHRLDPSGTISSPWPNVQDVGTLRGKLETYRKERLAVESRRDKLFVLQGILTASACEVLQSPIGGLEEWAREATPAVIGWLGGWADGLNIVIVDWYHHFPSYVRILVTMNLNRK